jgi:hypothetical protein
MKPDRSKVVDLFNPFGEEEVVVKKTRIKQKRELKQTRQKKKPTNALGIFEEKLEEGKISSFDHRDWYYYWRKKAEENGVRYITSNYPKDYAIIKSLMNELSWQEIKAMIDFVWDSEQDIQDKRTVGLWILSKGWVNTIYQNTKLWIDGDYKPKKAPKRNREWKDVAEASRKDSGTGINYGKPIRDDEEPQSSKPKKNKIRF